MSPYQGPGRLIGTGHLQEATPHRQAHSQEVLDQEYEYAVKSGQHLWLVVLTHKASDAILDSFSNPDPTDMPLLDVDTLLGVPVVACYVCEVMYEPRLKRRRCPGDPTPGGKS